jgi:hypothetical protein
MTGLQRVYLALALWGAVHPMYYFVQWFAENGLQMGPMLDAWHVNAARSGLGWDLTISAFALTVWVVAEVIQHRRWRDLVAIPATFCIGVSCGLPLYLFLRSQRRASGTFDAVPSGPFERSKSAAPD